VQQAEMQPVLIDRGQFASQTLVEIVDNFGVALHDALRVRYGQIRFNFLERF
jgi:hypothetical protein